MEKKGSACEVLVTTERSVVWAMIFRDCVSLARASRGLWVSGVIQWQTGECFPCEERRFSM